MRYSISVAAALLIAGVCVGQIQPREDTLPLSQSAQDAIAVWQAEHGSPSTTSMPHLNSALLKTQAGELAKLASGVPSDVQQVGQGLLPKELNAKLKRIEKLSKQLRQELNQR